MKVTITERKFMLPIAGGEYTLTEQEARELWASLDAYFGANDAGNLVQRPRQVVRPAIGMSFDTTQLPPGVEVVTG